VEAKQAPFVHLELESRPESVAIVRAMLAGAAELLEFGPELLADLKTAASEACNNVVMHAYGDGVGPLIVDFEASPATVGVTVRDCGDGIREMLPEENPVGLGIPVINALAARAEFLTAPAQGTEVRMLFAHHRDDIPQLRATVPTPPPRPPAFVEGQVVLSVTPVPLLSGILGRLAGVIAAQAFLSVDRYSDLYLITDGIASHAAQFASSDAISVGLSAAARRIDMQVGPFPPGTGSRLQSRDRPGPSSLHTLLVDQVSVQAAEGAETVQFTVLESRAGSAAAG
jgi:anti-sigma regulatory factor (Ser/Thr protein kinase)